MKIAIAQLNPIVGDLEGNAAKIKAAYEEGAAAGADLVIAPECVLTGYPLEDLVLRKSFLHAVDAATHDLCNFVLHRGDGPGLLFGAPRENEGGIYNSAFLVDPTPTMPIWAKQIVDKSELPNYGVFDEKRVFSANHEEPHPMNFRDHLLGVMICEDCWFNRVTSSLYNNGSRILIALNGSPFEIGKNVIRRQVVAKRIKETGLPFLYVNLVGGQDELVFDGGSFYYDGQTIQEAPHFEEGLYYFEVDIPTGDRYIENGNLIAAIRDDGSFAHWKQTPQGIDLTNYPTVEPSGIAEIYQACVMGLRDYMTKQGFKSAVLGYSGGVDSGIVAALAADALGHENVILVRLPSKYSSQHSLDDAEAGAKRLGASMRTIPIEGVVQALRSAYETAEYEWSRKGPFEADLVPVGVTPPKLTGVADENIQARARGNILMAISNQEGHLLLTTGNKSEVSVGYSTLYGDMSGGYNPIKDCYKTTVWEMCRWRNARTSGELRDMRFKGPSTEVVPDAIIVKPPSAELRPDQQDSDSLPPYHDLDAMLKGMIEDELSVAEIVAKHGFVLETVQRIRRLVDIAEYKRRQAAPGVKITSKIHGRDRRYPIVNRWR